MKSAQNQFPLIAQAKRMVDRTGQPVERSDSDHVPCCVRNVKSAQNQFPLIAQAKRMVDRTGFMIQKGYGTMCTTSSTFSPTLRLAERRIIPYSTEIHGRIQNYSYEFGC